MLTEEDKKARLDLYLWQYSNQRFFTIYLYDLLSRADAENRFKLSLVFPIEYEAFIEWQKCDNDEKLKEFFKQ